MDSRLSSLPDDIIHKILSTVSMKDVVKTSVLSSRWRYIWTSMPYLNFSTKEFPTWHNRVTGEFFPEFTRFVTYMFCLTAIIKYQCLLLSSFFLQILAPDSSKDS
jgi:hypothetical protein